jgi:sugar phosphate isomerase/epimerase
MTDWTKRLAIVSDEASESFAEAVDICLPLGIGAYELRSVDGNRFPHISEAAVEQILQVVHTHQLTLLGVSPGFCKISVDDPRVEEEFQAGFPQAFRLMERLGVLRLTTFSYLRGQARLSDPVPDLVVERLAQAAELCRREGIEMLIENSASCWGSSGERLAYLADTVGVGVTWDPANAAAAGEEAFPTGYNHVRPHITHVHCKNWQPGRGNVSIQEGMVDMAAQVAALQADGYAGYYCVEPHQWHDRANATRLNTRQLLQILADSAVGK